SAGRAFAPDEEALRHRRPFASARKPAAARTGGPADLGQPSHILLRQPAVSLVLLVHAQVCEIWYIFLSAPVETLTIDSLDSVFEDSKFCSTSRHNLAQKPAVRIAFLYPNVYLPSAQGDRRIMMKAGIIRPGCVLLAFLIALPAGFAQTFLPLRPAYEYP